MLIIHAKRKRREEIIRTIEGSDINAMISVNDIKTVYGGYGIRKWNIFSLNTTNKNTLINSCVYYVYFLFAILELNVF